MAGLPGGAAFDAVAVTSANAVRFASPELLGVLARLPCLAVGEASAEAARKAGFSQVVHAGGNAADLAVLALRTLKAGAQVAYLCGRVRKPGFEHDLPDAGFSFKAIETYDTRIVSYPTDTVCRILGDRPVDDVLVYSVLSTEALAGLPGGRQITQLFDKSILYCLSQRIADAFPPALRSRLRVSPSPDEAAMLGLLPRC